MDPTTQEPARAVQLWRSGVAYLYEHSRTQFHPALYVLLSATLFTATFTALLWALGLVLESHFVVEYELLGALAACVATAELTRGHVKYWLGISPCDWSFRAIAVGGAVLGLTFWAVVVLKWFDPRWYELPLMVGGGAIVYLVLGYLFRHEDRKKLRERHDT